MYEYSHGGNAIYERGKSAVIDLSANINPLGIPENVRDAIIGEIPNCVRYPDSFSNELRARIAEFEDTTSDRILCANGASDIIFRLPRALRSRKVMIAAPTFSDYERSARSSGSEVTRHTLSALRGFNMDDSYIEAVWNEKPDLVYVCNPNNPTGTLTEAGLIKKLLDCCRRMDAWAAVDECFLDFTENAGEYTSKVYIEQYPNLVILKAFTKIFSLPGIRLGYAICNNKRLIDGLYYNGADWPVSNLAQAAGIAALSGAKRFIKETAAYVSTERAKIKKELARLGYKVFESMANYVFIQNPYSFDLREELDKKAVRIRSCGNFHGLDESYCRIAVSTKENNDVLLTIMTEVTKPYMERRVL